MAAATTLKETTDTGVSVQTITTASGTNELVRQLNDLIDAEAQIGEIVAPARETDPLVVAALRLASATIDRALWRHSCAAGALTDDGLAPALRRAVGVIEPVLAWLPPKLASLALRPGLDATSCAHHRSPRRHSTCAAAIDDHQLTVEQVEDWIADTIVRATLKP
jgi:hypothetical protein